MLLDAKGAAADIASMRIRGATRIATHAAQALAKDIGRMTGPVADLHRDARRAADLLTAARPTSVALENAVSLILEPVLATGSTREAHLAAENAMAILAQALTASRSAIARHALPVLPNDGWVLTHCNSNAALAVLEVAHDEGKRFRVLVTETRPGRQGLITLRALANADIPCTLLVDSAVERALEEFDVRLAIVGADTVASDGSLFNKVGTAAIAVLCRQRKVPFHSAAGFLKFTRRAPDAVLIEKRPAVEVAAADAVPAGADVYNPVFDRTPAALITSYLTESGPASPAQAVEQALFRLPWKSL